MASTDTIFGWTEWQYREAAQRLIDRGNALARSRSGIDDLAELQVAFRTLFVVDPRLEWGSGSDARRHVERAWSLAKTECVGALP